MRDVVTIAENRLFKRIRFPKETENAAEFLVCRLITDAIFNNDVRAIKMIVTRIDGGLPKDVEVDFFQSKFGDCLEEILSYEDGQQMKILPSDTVMMALCKSLYALATQDIYWDYVKNKPIARPSTDRKQERDVAMQIILERVGGRKTKLAKEAEKTQIQDAEWINQLPENT